MKIDESRVGYAGLAERGNEQWLLQPGDILFSHINSVDHIGKCAVYRGVPAKLIHGMNLLCLRSNRDLLMPEFAKYLIRSDEFRERLSNFINKAVNQASVSIGNLKTIQVAVPPLSEQKRIAEILDRAEALRAKRRAALALLDELTQSIFLDMFGDPVTNPMGWRVIAMKDLFSASPIFGTMIPPSQDGGEWLSLRVANIQDWKLDLSDRKYVNLPEKSINRHSVQDGDLLMARAIATQEQLGKSVVVNPNGKKWAFDSHLMRLRFNKEKVEPEVIRHLLMTRGGRAIFLSASRRSAVQYNINTKEMAELCLPIPCIEVQREFIRHVVQNDAIKLQVTRSLSELDQLFVSLQHRAFRGEL